MFRVGESRCLLVLSVYIFCVSHLAGGTEQWRPGVVVEQVGNGTVFQQVGIVPGDILLSWELLPDENSMGEIGSFDTFISWSYFWDEFRPRGEFRLVLERCGEQYAFQIPKGEWLGVSVRPYMPTSSLAHYLASRANFDEKEIDKGTLKWNELMESFPREREDLLCWGNVELSKALAKNREWTKVNEALNRALNFASDDFLRTVIWEEIGRSKRKQYKFNEAMQAFIELSKAWERLEGEGLGFAVALYLRGVLEGDRGKLEVAESLQTLGRVIRSELAPNSLIEASSLSALGNISLQKGDFLKAEIYHEKSYSIRSFLSPDSLGVAASLVDLGNTTFVFGQPDRVLEYYRKAEKIVGLKKPRSLMHAVCLNRLGIVQFRKGDSHSAEKSFYESLLILRDKDFRHPTLASSYTGLAAVAGFHEDWEAADEFLTRSLAIKEGLSTNSLDISLTLANMSGVAIESGEYSKARQFLELALHIAEEQAPESFFYGSYLINMGLLLKSLGDFNGAILKYERALSIAAHYSGSNLLLSTVYNNLGNMYLHISEYERSLKYYEKALAIKSCLSPGSLDEARVYNGMAKAFLGLRMIGDAEAFFLKSIKALEQQFTKVTKVEYIKAKFQGRRYSYYSDYMDFLNEMGRHEEAYSVYERSRARVLYEMISKRKLSLAENHEMDVFSESFKRISYKYEKAMKDYGNVEEVKSQSTLFDLDSQLFDIRLEYRRFIEDMRRDKNRFVELYEPNVLDYFSVQEVLDPKSVLICYSLSNEKTTVFLVKPKGAIKTFTIERGLTYFSQNIDDLKAYIKEKEVSISQRLSNEILSSLFQILVDPVRLDIEKADRVVIIPDGPLQKLPFNLLLDKGVPGGRYFIEWKPITTVVSATIYKELKERKTRGVTKIAAFGDSIYSTPVVPEVDDFSIFSFDPQLRGFFRNNPNELGPLPYTKKEVEAIAQIFPGQTQVFLGKDASEENVKTLGMEPSIIHFASHGWANDRFPLESTLAFSIKPDFKEGEENGILQAWEIFESMRINADLVVMSGCETGLGKLTGSEGLVGLTRAFQFAGARSIIASLWSVEDESTAELMTRFYQNLKDGLSIGEALRHAQIDMIRNPIKVERPALWGLFNRTVERDVSHPFYWAGFQLIGPMD